MDLNKRYEEVVEFNALIGNLTLVTEENLRSQARVVKEEALELFDAIQNKEPDENRLKELCDLLVVSFGMLSQFKVLGYDVDSAFKLVNENNMTKFCNSPTDATYTAICYNATEGNAAYTKKLADDKWGVFSIHGKLLKPIGYEKVSKEALKEFCPII